jgi:hypothetical protein
MARQDGAGVMLGNPVLEIVRVTRVIRAIGATKDVNPE